MIKKLNAIGRITGGVGLIGLATSAAIGLGVNSASAVSFTLLNAQFNDGTSATGTFVYNPTGNPFFPIISILTQPWRPFGNDFFRPPGYDSSFLYSNVTFSSRSGFSSYYNSFGSQPGFCAIGEVCRRLLVQFNNKLPSDGGFVKPSLIAESYSYFDGTNGINANRSSYKVPEPLTILGTATALGFGAFFKRKLKSSESISKEIAKVG